MLVIFALVFIFVIIDQVSKYFVVKDMVIGQQIEVVNNFFYLTSHRNRGAAWGILQDSRLFFIVVTTIIILALFLYILKNKSDLRLGEKILFSLILGGSIGNFIDRIRNGEVVDFFDFKIWSYNFPIFNFADIFICIGVGILLIKTYREE
ncbi:MULTISPECIES: signal peptidase II [unclassified Gemella]|uniref:signal peptidase II n=1 Tax=unclassified Gemella TaxID=2624949 RepID=UPI0010744ACD|nr:MULTISPECIES: signal peptidase II [unclassified Gemella]MBF0746497.1 signal peptidase II [Gemella sp. 19428wG2_WT2a]MBF0848201.1 signal peptidase II [Streptococcus danieliae]TFU60276.1 signal peptidase II [Gemella sp. WT2a]MBF0710197.1 signal peptidase II [Gemella sp. GL1.1]NYS27541.1 signal peptidase II [Gemella sp. GL1]